MSVEYGDMLKFTRSNEYIFKKWLGQGGTGETVLLRDDILDSDFVCKKYNPIGTNDKEECFRRFIDEIKILYKIYHKNVVRIYSYYLYPQNFIGYIIMEYVDGEEIDKYLLGKENKEFENVFVQLIEGFCYLEEQKIIHRDIRSNNILITNDGVVKVIDFGFGKNIINKSQEDASIILNWPVTEKPDEISDWKYTSKTDMYFLGKLFKNILDSNNIRNFKYNYIIENMIKVNEKDRINSFMAIREKINKSMIENVMIDDYKKEIYMYFADGLTNIIIEHESNYQEYEMDSNVILKKLEIVLEESIFEDLIQNNEDLIKCFIKTNFKYTNSEKIGISVVKDFYELMKKSNTYEKELLCRNIVSRLRTVKISDDYDMPF